jgi:nucleoside phosphorylase
MREELKGIERDMLDAAQAPYAGGSILHGLFRGTPLVWVVSGIGRQNAERATAKILKDFQVEYLLVLGFAGSLSPQLGIGDLVICQTIRCEEAGSRSYHSDPGMVEMALKVETGQHRRIWLKDCLTVNRVLSTPGQKHEISRYWDVDIVEMENYWIAQQASQSGVRVLAVRAISDGTQDRLPEFINILDADGKMPVKRGLQHFSAHPHEITYIPRLYQNARMARKSLVDFFHAFYPLILKEGGLANHAH